MQKVIKNTVSRPCPICSEEGARQAIEVLPNGGILFMVGHKNGRVCKWAEYSSIKDLARPEKSKSPTYIKCPKCGDLGRLNWAHDSHAKKEEQPFTFSYIIVHEKTKGTWGSGKTKMDKRRRCQSFTPDQRIIILKQIGRYISDPPKPLKKKILKRQKSVVVQNSEEYPEISKARVIKVAQESRTRKISLDKYIEHPIELQSDIVNPLKKSRTTDSKSNPNSNLRCCVCDKLGTLRSRLRHGKLVYYFAHSKINEKEERHYISINNRQYMSYCKNIDRRQKKPIEKLR
jgi:hypothetical protein